MSEALLAFDKAIEPGDIALFFFAGHGFEIGGQNYLLPIDIPEVREGQEELIRISHFRPAGSSTGCRDVAPARRCSCSTPAATTRSIGRAAGNRGTGGLASMTPAEGVFIMFSAGAKQTALDRLSNADRASNSVFTRNLIRRLAERT